MCSSDLSSAFFEAKYQKNADPWDFATSAYELHRYDVIIASLAHRRYRRAFEPGCSVGVLTERLAGICEAVDAIDFSPTAVELAQRRCAGLSHVSVSCAAIAPCLPIHNCDLVVLSEMGYYFSPNEWSVMTARFVSPLVSGSIVLGTHWLGKSPDHRMSGDHVHEILQCNALLRLEYAERHEGFRLDRWVRV